MRTFPQLKSFNRGQALNDELQYLLELFYVPIITLTVAFNGFSLLVLILAMFKA